MKYEGPITDDKDLVTKEYVEEQLPSETLTFTLSDGTTTTKTFVIQNTSSNS